MTQPLEFHTSSAYSLRKTDDGDWAPVQTTGGLVPVAFNINQTVTPTWFGQPPGDAKDITVSPLSDGTWGVFHSGEQIGAMSSEDVSPLDADDVPDYAPEPAGDSGNAPTRSASVGEVGEDGWVVGKKPLEPGSADMPYLLPGRNMEEVLGNLDFSEPGVGLVNPGSGHFLPTLDGDFEANTQITSYEDRYLGAHNDALLDATEDSFLAGPILHNMSETEQSGQAFAETLTEFHTAADKVYRAGAGDPTIDQTMLGVADSLDQTAAWCDSICGISQGMARTSDGYNSITQSLSQATKDAYQQISDFAEDWEKWDNGTVDGAEPRPEFTFATDELNAAIIEAGVTVDELIGTEVDALRTEDTDGSGTSDEDRIGGRNEGGSTPAGPSPGVTTSPRTGSSGSATDVSGGANRGAAEKLADLLLGGQSVQNPGMSGFQMPQTYPTMFPSSTGMSGMIPTTDPYEALLNPATHLTQGFNAGDMSQIRQGNVTGADAATIRPYTAEARSADALLVSPNAAGPGAPTPRPTALGADMRPLDKDGDGKVDADAVAATKENTLDANGEPKQVKTAVMINGDPHAITLSDPRLLEMMNIIGADGDNGQSIDLLDAAKQAGVPLESFGEMLEDPTSAKPGDVVISSKGSGFYLGNSEVLLESGSVVPLGDVLELRPPQSGIFRLELPELPDQVDGAETPSDTSDTPSTSTEPVAGGAAPAPEADPVSVGAADVPEKMPDPAFVPEGADFDGDGIPDDNNGNGLIDELEPLPGAGATPEPVTDPVTETVPEYVPADEPDQVPEEPLFEGSASLNAKIDENGIHVAGSAEASIADVPFEGEALG